MRPYTVHDAICYEDASWILRRGLRLLWNRYLIMRPYTVHDASFIWGCILNSTRRSTFPQTPYNSSCVHRVTWRVLLVWCVFNSTKRSTFPQKPYISSCVHRRYMTRPSSKMRPEFYKKSRTFWNRYLIMRPYTVHDASFDEDACWILRQGLRFLRNRIFHHASIHGTWPVLLVRCVLNSTKRSTTPLKPLLDHASIHGTWPVLLVRCVLNSTKKSRTFWNRYLIMRPYTVHDASF